MEFKSLTFLILTQKMWTAIQILVRLVVFSKVQHEQGKQGSMAPRRCLVVEGVSSGVCSCSAMISIVSISMVSGLTVCSLIPHPLKFNYNQQIPGLISRCMTCIHHNGGIDGAVLLFPLNHTHQCRPSYHVTTSKDHSKLLSYQTTLFFNTDGR